MLTNNNFTVNGIIAKYVNTVNKRAWDNGSTHLDEPIELENEDGSFSVAEEVYNVNIFDSAECQLLAALYVAANKNSLDDRITDALSDHLKKFDAAVLTGDEMSFLVSHYVESIETLMRDPASWAGVYDDVESVSQFPHPFEEALPHLVSMPEGSTVYTPMTAYGSVFTVFPNSIAKGRCGSPETWALTEIRLQAQNIRSGLSLVAHDQFMGSLEHPTAADTDLVVLYEDRLDMQPLTTDGVMYDGLKPNGKMIILSDVSRICSMNDEALRFRQRIIKDHSLVAVIEMPAATKWPSRYGNSGPDAYFLLVVDKAGMAERKDVVMVDATVVSNHVNSEEGFAEALHVIDAAKNGDESSVLSYKRVPFEDLDADVLLPRFYMVKRPKDGVSLASIVQLADREPVTGNPMFIGVRNLGSDYDRHLINIDSLKKAGEITPNSKTGGMAAYMIHKPCVLFCTTGTDVFAGIVKKVPAEGLAVSTSVSCLLGEPANISGDLNEGLEFAAALLFEDTVKAQLTSLSAGSARRVYTKRFLDKVIVPKEYAETPRRLLFRMAAVDPDELWAREIEARQRYEKSIHLRKHALSQSLSAFAAMFNALNRCRMRQDGNLADSDLLSIASDKTVKDAFEFLSSRISLLQDSVAHIADTEYDFGEAEWIDPSSFMESYIKSHASGWLNFKALTTWVPGSNLAKGDVISPIDGDVILNAGDSITNVRIPHAALAKVFDNIISNARSHGFTDPARNDYRIRFSWHTEGTDVVIDVDNNGTPIKQDADLSSLMEYGYSTSLNKDGHSGIGCAEISSILKKYGGRTSIVSNPNEGYTVRYELVIPSNIERSFSL